MLHICRIGSVAKAADSAVDRFKPAGLTACRQFVQQSFYGKCPFIKSEFSDRSGVAAFEILVVNGDFAALIGNGDFPID